MTTGGQAEEDKCGVEWVRVCVVDGGGGVGGSVFQCVSGVGLVVAVR